MVAKAVEVVEVTEMFSPSAAHRPANFIVLKYFLLGMLISNGIESILIVPKTLSMMDENEEQLQKLDEIYAEHDQFKAQLEAYNREFQQLEQREYEDLQRIGGHNVQSPSVHHQQSPVATLPPPRPQHHLDEVDTNKLIEITLLLYGIVTLAIGIYAVFKEIPKLLMAFIGVVALGLVMLFFSGLTLLVFMAVLNDIIIAIVSFKFLQLLNSSVQAEYAPAAANYVPEAQYNVDLNQPSNYQQQ